jgi:nucleotide-binding universal stress UspA family protein
VCDFRAPNGFELYVRTIREIAAEHCTVAREQLECSFASEFPPDTCSRILRAGEAAMEIANLARRRGYDLIVMPTRAVVPANAAGSTPAKALDFALC